MITTPWQQLHRAAIAIDTAALSPRNRVQRDDQGQILDNGRPEPLLSVVVRTLVHLRDDLAEGQSPEDLALRHILQALVVALERVERESGNKKRGRRKRA